MLSRRKFIHKSCLGLGFVMMLSTFNFFLILISLRLCRFFLTENTENTEIHRITMNKLCALCEKTLRTLCLKYVTENAEIFKKILADLANCSDFSSAQSAKSARDKLTLYFQN